MSVSLRPDFPNRYKDHPIRECMEMADEILAKGGTIFQKFTCAGCGERLTMDTPDTFFASGTCDKCDTVTKITQCNFMATFSIPEKGLEK